MAKITGYEEQVILHHRRKRKKPLSRLYSVKRRVTDPVNEAFFAEMEIIVPHPSFETPIPCVIVFMQSSNGRCWFRANVDSLVGFFGLNDQDIAGIREALQRAEDLASRYEQAQREVMAILREQENLLRDQEKTIDIMNDSLV